MTNPPSTEPTVPIEAIRQTVRDLRLVVGRGAHATNEFKAGVVLLSAVSLGTSDLDRICSFTGYSPRRNIVQKFIANMERSGLYRDGVFHVGWFSEDEGEGITALCLDMLVVAGKLDRVPTPPGTEEQPALPESSRGSPRPRSACV
jgi:hypothetical protein